MCCFVSTFTHDRDCKNNNLFFMHLFLAYFSQKKRFRRCGMEVVVLSKGGERFRHGGMERIILSQRRREVPPWRNGAYNFKSKTARGSAMAEWSV